MSSVVPLHTPPSTENAAPRQRQLAAQYQAVRARTIGLIGGLSAEDCQLQSMSDASPVKWHLAHTTWFFETFVLEVAQRGYRAVNAKYRVLFNSYYVGVGARHPRGDRGLLSRPSLEEVLTYRRKIDTRMVDGLLQGAWSEEILDRVQLGLEHESQHQELILTDIKHHFWCNPLRPAYKAAGANLNLGERPSELEFIAYEGGLAEIGHEGDGFVFDNEKPRHRVWLEAFEIASRPVTNAEYQEFINDGGYRKPQLWLADGWDLREKENWRAPLYWQAEDSDTPRVFTLAGLVDSDPDAPVCHVSFYEADAYARWAGARLPSEAEWERVAQDAGALPDSANLLERGLLNPYPGVGDARIRQLFGDVWEWTGSAYLPYPGYKPLAGALGEYNGKFMVNQMVLRGGSCVTPRAHARMSYRNFFAPSARWQFAGIRLARSLAHRVNRDPQQGVA
jgi:ergothioneine biosynthesis protein EgtB